MPDDQPKVQYLKDYEPSPFLVTHADLAVDIHDGYCDITSKLSIRSRTGKTDMPCHLDGVELELKDIALDSKPLSADQFTHAGDGLTIRKAPANFELTTTVRLLPDQNRSLEGLYRSGDILCTQCEAQGFRKITFFLDRPDNMATFQVRITADQRFPTLLSNGNLVKEDKLPDGRHFAQWDDPFPKPAYLFAMVIGDLAKLSDTFTTSDGRDIQLGIYASSAEIDQCAHAMESLKRSMAWDETAFGLTCDLDVYNVVAARDFNMGAMENKGLNIFNSNLLLADETSTTDDRFRDIENVIAHEYFHNWTGNRVTCRDWFQLCLKEGLTVFRDQLFSQDHQSEHIMRIRAIMDLRNFQFGEDASPMAHPPRPDRFIEINNFYTATVYQKGAEVVRIIYTLLGRSGFCKGMELYFERHDGQAVTQEDFVAAMGDANGRDLSQVMRWYTQAGTPTLSVKSEYDEQAKKYHVHFQQTVPKTSYECTTEAVPIPVRLGLLDQAGDPVPLRVAGENLGNEMTFELNSNERTLTLEDVSHEPTPSLMRGFSAPVKLKDSLSDEQRIHLIKHDSDPVNRWDQAQAIWLDATNKLITQYQSGSELKLDPDVEDLFRYLIEHPDDDLEFTACLWGLPSFRMVQLSQESIDVEAIAAARKKFAELIASANRNRLLELTEQLKAADDPGFSQRAIAIRALRNTCLSFLAAIEDEEGLRLTIDRFSRSRHMSDVLWTFGLLCEWNTDYRPTAIEIFYERFENYPTAIDDWFMCQARARLPGALQRVENLLQHPAFRLDNPNRMRSLLCGFCHANPVQFHATDGSGYQFCSEYIVKLDRINPQMATILARAFLDWKRHTPERQQLMRTRLTELVQDPKLSKDVYEIVAKTLD